MMKSSTPSGPMFMSFSSPKGATSTAAPACLVAGMDISSWEIVHVDGVPPGPLGILLDGNSPDAAVLEDFAPISSDGTKGAVELDGRVVTGSVLVGVNEYDLLQHKLTLQEIGKVLRETSHLVRTLAFRVPSTLRALDAAVEASSASSVGSPVGETAHRVLLKGVEKSSFKDPAEPAAEDASKRAWDFKSMLSPTQLAGSVAAMAGFGSQPLAPAAPTTALTTAPAVQVAPAAPVPASPPPTGIRSPSLAGSSPSKSVAFSSSLTVKIPPGPIGLHLDGAVADRAVVLRFLPLPDGSTGALERRGDLPIGSVLVAVNGSSVAHLTLDDVRARLSALAGVERELEFELPVAQGSSRELTAVLATAKPREAAFHALGDLDKRRKIELGLVLQHDQTTIKRHECWCLIDMQWMARWIQFTARGGVNPGPITNHVLLESNWEARASGLAAGRPDAPRAGLALLKDYRCVGPMVWAILAECHGCNDVPVQARYVLDAYAEPLAETDVTAMLQEPRLKAATIVSALREKYPAAYT